MGKSSSGGVDNRQNSRDSTPSTSSAPTFKPRQPLACFLCNGPHRVRNCPHKGVMSALQASKQQISNGHHPPSQRKVEEIFADRTSILRRKPTLEYLVNWEGLGPEEVSWERALDLQAFQQKIEEFLAMKSTRSSTV
ncbi:hypothetical protein COLO4_37650 [Corchorus olitorius]|uniref:Chromo domain-containing protein n=1 Tax=Corchorus olitorius TaxID=93759 RepID=A0A1R3G087_9ROSI|nr:hypothetical protein COLO4_37650 [Corchorus olitorius]